MSKPERPLFEEKPKRDTRGLFMPKFASTTASPPTGEDIKKAVEFLKKHQAKQACLTASHVYAQDYWRAV